MTRHEYLRECWNQNPEKFEASDYEKGYPVPTEKGWMWHEWPETSDINSFAREAAKAMLSENPLACPLDICDFATVLRRKYILERMGLPDDPESLNVARIIEMLKAREKESFLSTAEAMEAIAEFCLKVSEAKDFHNLSEMEKIDLIDILESSQCRNLKTDLSK